MKTYLLLSFLFLSQFLFCESSLNISSGYLYPNVCISGAEIQTDQFSSLVGFSISEDKSVLNKAYFVSENLSVGSFGFSGFLTDHEKENKRFFNFDDQSEVFINRAGNPLTNMGILFSLEKPRIIISANRVKETSQVLFHGFSNFSDDFRIGFTQSFSRVDGHSEDDSWYLDEYALKSSQVSLSSISLLKGREDFFAGGQVSSCYSSDDPRAYSLLLSGAYPFFGLIFQNEIKISTPYFVTADLNVSNIPFLFKGKVYREHPAYSLESSLSYFQEEEPLPWKSRLWGIDSNSVFSYNLKRWKIKENLGLSLFNEDDGSFGYNYSLGAEIMWTKGNFFLGLKGKMKYEEIYAYLFSLKCSFDCHLIEISFSPEVEIARKIVLNLFGKGKFLLHDFILVSSFSLEDIGLYVCEDLVLKPSFFIGTELDTIKFFKKRGQSQKPAEQNRTP